MSAEQRRNNRIYGELRPRKSRTRTGCLPCRARRKKCDEARPICQSCIRLQLICTWPVDTAQASTVTSSTGAEALDSDQAQSSTAASDTPLSHGPLPLEDEGFDASGMPKDDLLAELRQLTTQFHQSGIFTHQESMTPAVRQQIQDTEGPETAMLFDHFCHKTAPWMINGHGYDNPVLKFVVPLMITDELVLRTAIAISGTHLLHTMPSIATVASKYYSYALQGLRERLSGWVGGTGDDYRPILVTMILLCHCEFISGNTYGAALQHLRACQQFVDVALQHLNKPDHQDFVVYVLEHFGYFTLIANLRCCLQEDNIRLGLHFAHSILPLIKDLPSFGSIFAYEPESIALIPQVAQLAWDRSRDTDQRNLQSWQMVHRTLVDGLNAGRIMALRSDNGQQPELQAIFSIKINALLMSTHEAFYETEEDYNLLRTVIQPLIDSTIQLLADVDETDFCYGLFWSLVLTGTYIQDQDQQEFLARKLQSNKSSMSFFSKGAELLRWLWTDQVENNFGLAGLERTAVDHGVEICLC